MARHDRAWLGTSLRMIDAGTAHKVPADTVWRMLAGVWVLIDAVQDVVNERGAGEADSLLALDALTMSKSIKLADYAAQLRAMLAYDFGKRVRSDSAIARRLKGQFLVIHAPEDRVVSAGPALSLARQMGLDSLTIRSSCGHGVFGCEAARIGAAIQAFLDR